MEPQQFLEQLQAAGFECTDLAPFSAGFEGGAVLTGKPSANTPMLDQIRASQPAIDTAPKASEPAVTSTNSFKLPGMQ